MAGRWPVPSLRWLDISFPLRTSIFQWPQVIGSYIGSPRWGVAREALLRLPDLELSFLDDVVWSLVTAFESLALVSMLAFFFLFCGCTI